MAFCILSQLFGFWRYNLLSLVGSNYSITRNLFGSITQLTWNRCWHIRHWMLAFIRFLPPRRYGSVGVHRRFWRRQRSQQWHPDLAPHGRRGSVRVPGTGGEGRPSPICLGLGFARPIRFGWSPGGSMDRHTNGLGPISCA